MLRITSSGFHNLGRLQSIKHHVLDNVETRTLVCYLLIPRHVRSRMWKAAQSCKASEDFEDGISPL